MSCINLTDLPVLDNVPRGAVESLVKLECSTWGIEVYKGIPQIRLSSFKCVFPEKAENKQTTIIHTILELTITRQLKENFTEEAAPE